MESAAVLARWTEYCKGLTNYNLQPDTSILQEDQTSTREAKDLPVLQEEVELEAAVRSLKTGKSPAYIVRTQKIQ